MTDDPASPKATPRQADDGVPEDRGQTAEDGRSDRPPTHPGVTSADTGYTGQARTGQTQEIRATIEARDQKSEVGASEVRKRRRSEGRILIKPSSPLSTLLRLVCIRG